MRLGLLALASISCLVGCSRILGVQSGAAVLAIPRKNTPVVGTLNAHLQAGPGERGGHSAIMVGPEANLRATNDYGHLDWGLTLTRAAASPRWLGYARAALDPVGISWRNGRSYYAFGSGVEIGGGWAWNGRYDPGRFVSDTTGDAITLSLRGDLEARPDQLQADIFVGLMVGVAFYTLAGPRR
jgi:hypothetical protein